MGQDALQNFSPYAKAAAGDLHDGAVRFADQSYCEGCSNHPFAADHGDLHAAAIAGDDHHGNQAPIQKIGIADFFACFMEDLPMAQFHRVEVWAQAGEFLRGDCQQGHVLHRIPGDVYADRGALRDRLVPSVNKTSIVFHRFQCGTLADNNHELSFMQWA